MTEAIVMRNPYNPTPEEIRAWAYDADAMEPVQDFDLMVADEPNDALCLELAADPACPKRRWFLSVLYLVVGDAVRSGFKVRSREAVEALLERGGSLHHPDVEAWRRHSRALLDDPRSFDYDAWCAGGLARAETRED